MAFQSQFKAMIRTFPVFIGSFAPDVLILCHVLPAKMCRNGTRENCPVQKCRFQHTTPAHVVYSSAPPGPPPTPVISPARAHLPSAEHGARGWCGEVNAQLTRSSVEDAAPRDVNGNATAQSGTALDAKALAQGTVVLAACSACQLNVFYDSDRRTRGISRVAREPSRGAEAQDTGYEQTVRYSGSPTRPGLARLVWNDGE